MDENLAWLTQKTEDLKRSKEKLTFFTHSKCDWTVIKVSNKKSDDSLFLQSSKKEKEQATKWCMKKLFENLGSVIAKASWGTPKVEFTTSDMNPQLQGAHNLFWAMAYGSIPWKTQVSKTAWIKPWYLSIYISICLHSVLPLFLLGGWTSNQINKIRGWVDRTSRGTAGKERGRLYSGMVAIFFTLKSEIFNDKKGLYAKLFFSLITKHSSWQILINNLSTVKRKDGAKDEKL